MSRHERSIGYICLLAGELLSKVFSGMKSREAAVLLGKQSVYTWAELRVTDKRPMLSHQDLGILAYKPRASSENALNTTPSANIASCDTVAASHTPIAAFIICQKP